MPKDNVFDPNVITAVRGLGLAYDKVHYEARSAALIEAHCDRAGATAPLSTAAAEANMENQIAGAVTKAAEEQNPQILAGLEQATSALLSLPVDQKTKHNALDFVLGEHVFTPVRAGIAQGREACSQPRQFRR